MTWRLDRSQQSLTPSERGLLVDILRHFVDQRYVLRAYAIMDDHVHVMLQPIDGCTLQSIVHTCKSYSAHLLQKRGRRGRIWEREYYDRIIRNRSDYEEKLAYILTNPQRRWPGVTNYPWAWYDSKA